MYGDKVSASSMREFLEHGLQKIRGIDAPDRSLAVDFFSMLANEEKVAKRLVETNGLDIARPLD